MTEQKRNLGKKAIPPTGILSARKQREKRARLKKRTAPERWRFKDNRPAA